MLFSALSVRYVYSSRVGDRQVAVMNPSDHQLISNHTFHAEAMRCGDFETRSFDLEMVT